MQELVYTTPFTIKKIPFDHFGMKDFSYDAQNDKVIASAAKRLAIVHLKDQEPSEQEEMSLEDYVSHRLTFSPSRTSPPDEDREILFFRSNAGNHTFFIDYMYCGFVYCALAHRLKFLEINYDLYGCMKQIMRIQDDASYAAFSLYMNKYIKYV